MVDFSAVLARAGFQMSKTSGYAGYSGYAGKSRLKNKDILAQPSVTICRNDVVTLVTTPSAEVPVTTVTTPHDAVITGYRDKNDNNYQRVSGNVTSVTTVTTEKTRIVSREIDEAEREAIASELGGVPVIYAKAFAAIQARPPTDVPQSRWNVFVNDAGLFLDAWGRQAEALGWSSADLFDLDPVAPMARYDRMGLLWMLKGQQRVVVLTSSEARLSGGLAFYRRRP